jgi:molecular chaperone HscB
MQAERPKNYFELFGLAERFDLDPDELTARYRELQRRFHPDRYANRPDSERRHALQLAATINEAFQTLKEPLARGRYLLKLRGVDTDAETGAVLDSVFLAEQMELREALAEAGAAADRSERLAGLTHTVEDRFAARCEELRRCLAADGQAERAVTVVHEMQFLAKLRRELAEMH